MHIRRVAGRVTQSFDWSSATKPLLQLDTGLLLDLDAAAFQWAPVEADRSRIADCRAEQEARIRRNMAAHK